MPRPLSYYEMAVIQNNIDPRAIERENLPQISLKDNDHTEPLSDIGLIMVPPLMVMKA
jgi:hypothetical protein